MGILKNPFNSHNSKAYYMLQVLFFLFKIFLAEISEIFACFSISLLNSGVFFSISKNIVYESSLSVQLCMLLPTRRTFCSHLPRRPRLHYNENALV